MRENPSFSARSAARSLADMAFHESVPVSDIERAQVRRCSRRVLEYLLEQYRLPHQAMAFMRGQVYDKPTPLEILANTADTEAEAKVMYMAGRFVSGMPPEVFALDFKRQFGVDSLASRLGHEILVSRLQVGSVHAEVVDLQQYR